jgi:hypothetical protein
MPDVPSPKRSRRKRTDWDGAWKEALQQLFPAFLELLFPALYAAIDWTQEPVFLEQELRQVTRRAKRGKGAVDKLARVRLLDGRQATLLVHVEFQNQVDSDLPTRLYNYNIGIYSLLQERVITLAVLGDNDPQWRPAEFGYALVGFDVRMRFPLAKLLDYQAYWSVLESNDNPFAVIVMAHLKALETVRQSESRLEWKLRLAKALYDRAYSELQIQQLVDFIDWLMVLDDRREARFDEALRQYEEERTMPTLSPYQKRFIAKGKAEGREEGLQEGREEGREEGVLATLHEAVLEALSVRFHPVPEDIGVIVEQITDQSDLKRLLRAAIQATTVDEFRSLLPE